MAAKTKWEPIPADVIDGLKILRLTGLVFMLDREEVLRHLAKMARPAHDWLQANPGRYMEALLVMGNTLGVSE